jgi:hypothetical protein
VQINIGYEIVYHLPQPTPMLLTVHVHPSRASEPLVDRPARSDHGLKRRDSEKQEL